MTSPEELDKYNTERPPRGLGEKVLAFFHLPYVPPIAVINKKDFEAAQRDPDVIKMLNDAREYGERMEAEDQINP